MNVQVKCYQCKNHTAKAGVHQCVLCKTKTVFGEIQEPFMEYCENFERKNYEIHFNPEKQ